MTQRRFGSRAQGSCHFLVATFHLVTLLSCAGCSQQLDDQENVETKAAAVVAGPCNGTPVMPLSCSPTCASAYCGGIPWTNQVIPYQITQNSGVYSFDAATMQRIRDRATDWTNANRVVSLVECPTYPCTGYTRWLDISPYFKGQGIITQTPTGPQYMTLANGASNWSVSHEIGHSIGLPHEFIRFDRDRYEKFNPIYFCDQNNVNILPKCKSDPSSDPAFPAIPTGLFGVYSETSVMNYFSADICENNGQEPSPSDTPNADDGSAVAELYRVPSGWAPFESLGTDVSQYAPLDYSLAPGVSMVGSPAVDSWAAPLLDVFARGSDGHIYQKYKNLSGGVFAGWSSWVDQGGVFNSDPASVSWASGRVDVVARKADGNIYIKSYGNGAWSGWSSLGAPAGGAASAPAITSWGPNRLDVFVSGTSGQLFQRTYDFGWGAWAQRGNGTFLGKPAAVSWGTSRIDVFAHGMDHALWTISYDGSWHSWSSLAGELYHNGSVNSSPAVASWGANRLDVFIRGTDSKMWQKAWTGASWTSFLAQGGIMSGDAATVAKSSPVQRIDIIIPSVDHGSTGPWWKYYPYTRPCYLGGAQCGSCGE